MCAPSASLQSTEPAFDGQGVRVEGRNEGRPTELADGPRQLLDPFAPLRSGGPLGLFQSGVGPEDEEAAEVKARAPRRQAERFELRDGFVHRGAVFALFH